MRSNGKPLVPGAATHVLRPLSCSLAALAFAACGGASRGAAPAAALPAVLARCSAALPAEVRGLATSGELEAAGLRGSFESIEDLRTGRSRSKANLGELLIAEGFDGELGWQRDPGGEVAVLDSQDSRLQRRTAAWLVRRGYFVADGTTYRELGAQRFEGRELVGLAAQPAQAAPVELWFDAARCELARTVHHEGAEEVVTTLSDYRQVEGVAVPFLVQVHRRDPRNDTRQRVTGARLLRELAAGEFEAPATPTADAKFTGPERRAELPFDLLNQHVYIRAEIDGKPVRMLVDTGGVNLVTTAAAARLGLPLSGKMGGAGVGAGSVEVSFTRASRLTLGALELSQPRLYVFPMDELMDIEGETFDGIIGFELFQRFAVTLDYPARRMVVTDAARLVLPASALRVPFSLVERIPVVEGSLNGLPARLSIDTGSRASASVTAPFARKHELVRALAPRFSAVTGWGVGGAVHSSPVRIAELRLGPAVLPQVVGDLFLGDRGAFVDTRFDINIGGGILRRFVVTFDYVGRVMYLVPGPEHDARDGYDRSGMFLRRKGELLQVVAITPGGPAELAGVRAGDLIRAIDGVAVASRHLSQWRRELVDGAVGSRRVLELERAGASGQPASRLTVPLVLAELLP